MSRVYRDSTSKGFSLIEILIALFIVAIGVLAVGSFGVATLNTGQVSRERLTAIHLAEQVLEHWQNDANDRAPTIAANCVQSDATAVPSYPVTTTCTPATGTEISFTILVDEALATGPMAGDLNNFSDFAQPAAYSNTPNTKLVTVTWSNKGESRSVYLTHMAIVK
ncbi:MAG: prepilin-type N-terminal cleavage/methylation domain-containing protein [Mariprofundus sp.]